MPKITQRHLVTIFRNYFSTFLLAVLPFNNTLDTVTMTGQSIKNVLENQLENQDKTVLQISGGKLYYKRLMNKKWILDNLQLPCGSNHWCNIEDTKVYSVSLTAYLSNGGGGWTFPKYILSKKVGPPAYVSLQKYIQNQPMINQRLENRIIISYELQPENDLKATKFLTIFVIICILVLLLIVSYRICHFQPKPCRITMY